MKININTGERKHSYDVVIESGCLEKAGRLIKPLIKDGARAMIVSETNVFPLYGKVLEGSLAYEGIKTSRFIFDAGEEQKTLKTVYSIYEALAENGMTRQDIIISLGGGVAGDMAGFAAATYLRGIDFVQIPTTLLSQVDASVGGKTGVDIAFGKNLVGAFHQPLMVIADPKTLKTLPEYYMQDGMAEVIKYGCIDDEALFELMGSDGERDQADIISRCVLSKKSFVEEDTADKGRRMILNFGHTFGHALEKLHNFRELSHGMAVGIGMVLAAQVGEAFGLTEAGTAERIKLTLERNGLKTETSFSNEEIIAATALDKKSEGDEINLILLEKIGKAVIYKTNRAAILEALNSVR